MATTSLLQGDGAMEKRDVPRGSGVVWGPLHCATPLGAISRSVPAPPWLCVPHGVVSPVARCPQWFGVPRVPMVWCPSGTRGLLCGSVVVPAVFRSSSSGLGTFQGFPGASLLPGSESFSSDSVGGTE